MEYIQVLFVFSVVLLIVAISFQCGRNIGRSDRWHKKMNSLLDKNPVDPPRGQGGTK